MMPRSTGEMYLQEAQSNNLYFPEKAVPRAVEEKIRREVIEGDKVACVLVGGPGIGKTHVVCNLIRDYSATWRTWAYGLLTREIVRETSNLADDIEKRIAEDLGVSPDGTLDDYLHKNQTLIFIDGLENPDKYRAPVGSLDLMEGLDSLVRKWSASGCRVKVLITCVTSTWNSINRSVDIETGGVYLLGEQGQVLEIDRLYPGEFREAYRNYLGILPDEDPDQFQNVNNLCAGDPFVLRLVAEVLQNDRDGSGSSSTPLSLVEVFDRYYNEKILMTHKLEKAAFFPRYVKGMLDQCKEVLPRPVVAAYQDTAFDALLNEGYLVENPQQGTVQLLHPRLTEYFLMAELHEMASQVGLQGFVDKAWGFPALWAALVSFLASEENYADADDVVEMARSGLYVQQQLVRDVLRQTLGSKVQVERGKEIVRRLLALNDHEAQSVAVSVIFPSRFVGEFVDDILAWIHSNSMEAAKQLYLHWREVNGTSLEDRLWQDLSLVVETAWKRFFGGKRPSRAKRAAIRLLSKLQEKTRLGRRLPGQERSQELMSVFNSLLSFSWFILINDCYNEVTINRITVFWAQAINNAKSFGVWDIVEQRLPETVEGRIKSFAEQINAKEISDLHQASSTIGTLLDHEADLDAVVKSKADLLSLIQSIQLIPAALGSLAMSIQTHRDFSATRPVLTDVFEQANQDQKLAILVGFALHAEPANRELVDELARFTEQLLVSDPSYLVVPRDPWGKSQKYKTPFALAGLGFAWCNLYEVLRKEKPTGIRPVIEIVNRVPLPSDERLLGAINSLIPIGINFPEAVMETYRSLGALDNPALEDALIRAVDIISLFNSERMTQYRRSYGFDVRPSRLSQEDYEMLVDLAYWLSTVNFIYFSLHRNNLRPILVEAIQSLAYGRSVDRVLKRLSSKVFDLIMRKHYRLEDVLEA